ncbi:MAG: hypothetical protein Q9174_006198 [Haloplaca sp. 1 TL-2023]
MAMFLPAQDLLLLYPLLLVVYFIIVVIYRLYFSPLAKFPGPRLAASTLWYEYYYDVMKRGRYTWKIAELHSQYGEEHLLRYYDELYVGPSKRRSNKYEWSVRGFGPFLNAASTVGHDLHRVRRGAVAPFFSKSLVQQQEPYVREMVDKLVSRLDKLKGTGAVINLVNVFPCLGTDIFCQYAFASPHGYLEDPDFAPSWHKAVTDASESGHLFKQFPWLETLMRKLPPAVVRRIAPDMGSLSGIVDMISEKVSKVQDEVKRGKRSTDRRTIFHDIIDNDQIRPEEKTQGRLLSEGFSLLGGGTATVALTLSVISYHVIANPQILQKLQDELAQASPKMSSPPTWSQLEQLPYLGAIIQEGLRRAYGVSHRLARISPDTDLQYKEWTIPRGVSLRAPPFTHYNIFVLK